MRELEEHTANKEVTAFYLMTSQSTTLLMFQVCDILSKVITLDCILDKCFFVLKQNKTHVKIRSVYLFVKLNLL